MPIAPSAKSRPAWALAPARSRAICAWSTACSTSSGRRLDEEEPVRLRHGGHEIAMKHDSDRREAALDWLVRTNDPEFDGWDDFTAWLEASPANADAYHRLPRARPRCSRSWQRPWSRPDTPDPAIAQRRLAWWPVPRFSPLRRPRRSAHDAHRIFDRARRSPDDRPRRAGPARHERRHPDCVSGWDRRRVRLEQGQVAAQAARPDGGRVELLSGDLELVDVGTVFEVSRDGRETRVLVSEGAVVADPDGARVRLAAGQRLDTEDGANGPAGDGRPTLRRSDRSNAASSSISMSRSIMSSPDLRGSTGIDFSAECRYQHRRFTGTLSVRRGQSAIPTRWSPCWAFPWSGQVKAGSWKERSSD